MTRKRTQQGFTLIELMTSVTIFAVVVTVSLGAIIGIFQNNRKSRSLRATMSNLNLAMESVSREMRFGSNYHCGSSQQVTSPLDCPSGDTSISFLSSDNVQLTYQLNNGVFERQVGTTGNDWQPVIPTDVTIDGILFMVTGSMPNDGAQPGITMKMTAHSGTSTARTDLSLQTYISQRIIDN